MKPDKTVTLGWQYTFTFKSDLSFLNTSNSQCNGFYEVNQEDRKLILYFESGCSSETSVSTVAEITNDLIHNLFHFLSLYFHN